MSRHASNLILLSLALPLAACASSGSGGGDGNPPTLTVTTPERGTVSDSATVTVTGTVTGQGTLSVKVNGGDAMVAPDGTWTAQLSLDPGVEVLETIATDGDGDTARDVRAVMSGDLQPTTGYVQDAVGAQIGAGAFNVMGGVVDNVVNHLDLGAIARPMNPAADVGGSCFGAKVNVTDATIGNFNIDLTPQPNSLAIDATVTNLAVYLDVPFDLACIGGDDSATVTADSVQLTGALSLWVDGGQIHAGVSNVSVQINGLYLDVGGLPNSIVNLFSDQIAGMIENTLTTMIDQKVPPQVESMLSDMAGKSYSLPLLGKDIAMQIAPSNISVDYNGAFVAIDTTMAVSGGDTGVYVASPEPLSGALMSNNDGLGLALSDDAMNQLFGGLWASGALDQTIPVPNGSPIGLLFGGDTRQVKLSMSLPPTASMDPSGNLRLTVGDMIIDAEDADGNSMANLSLSLTTTLGATVSSDNHIQMQLGTAKAWAQIISQSDKLPVPLSDKDLEGMISTLSPLVSKLANDALAGIPLPSMLGVSLSDPQMSSHDGYVVVTAGLTLN